MRRQWSVLCLLVAWFCANGVVLDVVQVYAWARMFTGYTRTMPIGEAAVQTMDPGKPCAICVAVRRAREVEGHQQPAAVPPRIDKILLASVKNEPFVVAPVRPEWPDTEPALNASWRTSVPVPPPRIRVRAFVG